MAKLIKLTKEIIDSARADFEKMLASTKLAGGKIEFNKVLGNVDRKATLEFSPLAHYKMATLVSKFDKEVGWHGTARRGENDTYYIDDIIIYPQQVTGATVNTDQEEYQTWLMELDDEVFNNLRMQGHSHVNMGVTPSSVDTTLYQKFLDQLDDDMFYIFLIWNKREEKTILIYDMRENILFETKDVTVTVTGTEGFVEEAKKLVTDKTFTPSKYNMYSGFTSPYTGKNKPSEGFEEYGARSYGYYGKKIDVTKLPKMKGNK